ncbi:MAG: hypothetical protein KJO28_10375, partial [Desulfofustis sp.]|nr:hypothetical protein [Desulfofustis sp.]
YVLSFSEYYGFTSDNTPAQSIKSIMVDGTGTIVGHMVQPSPDAEVDWNTAIMSTSDSPAVTALADGSFVVTFNSENYSAGTDLGVYSHHYIVDTPFAEPASWISLSTPLASEELAGGSAIGTLHVLDPDAGDTHSLSLIDDSGGIFSLSGTNLLSLASGQTLDFETGQYHDIVVQAIGSDGIVSDHSVRVMVDNVVEYDDPDIFEVRDPEQTNYLDMSAITSPTLVFGEDGDDTIIGSDFDDIIKGGAGADIIDGGAGNDIFVIWGTIGADYANLNDTDETGETIIENLVDHAVAGEELRGGIGEDTLIVYGTADLGNFNVLESVEHQIVNSNVAMSIDQIADSGLASIKGGLGDEPHILNITGNGTVDLSSIAIDNIDEINVDPEVELILTEEQEATLPINVVESPVEDGAGTLQAETEIDNTVEPIFGDGEVAVSEVTETATENSSDIPGDDPLFGDAPDQSVLDSSAQTAGKEPSEADPGTTEPFGEETVAGSAETEEVPDSSSTGISGEEPLFGDGTAEESKQETPIEETVEPLLADSSADTAMDVVVEDTATIDDTVADAQADGDVIWLVSQTDDVDSAA